VDFNYHRYMKMGACIFIFRERARLGTNKRSLALIVVGTHMPVR
jgi:hypothetical protein